MAGSKENPKNNKKLPDSKENTDVEEDESIYTDGSSVRNVVNYVDEVESRTDRLNLVVRNSNESVIHIHSTAKDIDISLLGNNYKKGHYSSIEIYQNTHSHKVLKKHKSESDTPTELNENININRSTSNICIEISDVRNTFPFSYSMSNSNKYQHVKSAVSDKKSICSAPVVKNFYHVWNRLSSVFKKSIHPVNRENPAVIPGPSGLQTSSDELSFKSAIDEESDMLNVVRVKNVSPNEDLMKLIIKQGDLLNSSRRHATLNAYRGEVSTARNDYQPPPPYQETSENRSRIDATTNSGDNERRQGERPGFFDISNQNDIVRAQFTKAVRRRFVQKVYAILSVQLLFSLIFILCVTFIVVWLISYMIIVCSEHCRRTYPLNFIVLAVVTMSYTYIAGSVAAYVSVSGVFLALGSTTGLVLSISLIACFVKFDILSCIWIATLMGLTLMIFCLISMIIYFVSRSPILIFVYSGLMVAYLSLALIIDTALLVGGKRMELSPEEYILGALTLYMDIILILVILFCLIGRSN